MLPDALRYAAQSSAQYVVMAPPPLTQPVCAMQQHSAGASMALPSHPHQHLHQQQHQRSPPSYNAYYGSPAAQSEHPLPLQLFGLPASVLLPAAACLPPWP